MLKPVEISPLVGVGFSTADEGGIEVCGVSVGTNDVMVESAIVIVRDGEQSSLRGYCHEYRTSKRLTT